MADSAEKAEPTTASCQEECSGQARDAVTPVDGTGLEGLHTVVLLRVLQVREQRLGLVGRADLEILAHGQVVDRGEENRVAHDAGDRVNNKLVRAGAVDNAGTASVDLAMATAVTVAATVTTTAAAARRGGDGFSGHLEGALGGGLRGCLGLRGVAVAMSAASAASVLSSGGLLGGSGLLGALLLTFAAASTPAATTLGGDGVGVDQLEHLTVSHVFSLSFGPQGHFSEPYPV